MIQQEYKVRDFITISDLLKFGFIEYRNKRYMFGEYLYKKIIRAKYVIDLAENEMTWEVYDTTNQKPYFAFYCNPNGMRNQVVIECYERYNEVIEKMAKAGIIEGE